MTRYRLAWLIFACTALLILMSFLQPCSYGQASSSGQVESSHYKSDGGRSMSFDLKSSAFSYGSEIARKYACGGADISPALSWSNVPAGTQSLALIAEDPDAPMGTWTHWIIWNIPAQATTLPEGVPKMETLDNGVRQGRNDFKRIGYGGPCPPPGKPHHYFFRLYALSAKLDVKAGADRRELEAAMKRHIISETSLMGTYKR